MAEHNDFGKWGEDRAAEYLEAKGYRIVNRNWKLGHHDIDIVAIDGGTFVFVEVKTRHSDYYVDPYSAACSRQKLWSMAKPIKGYLNYYHINGPWRYDVITIVCSNDGKYKLDHTEDINIGSQGYRGGRRY